MTISNLSTLIQAFLRSICVIDLIPDEKTEGHKAHSANHRLIRNWSDKCIAGIIST